MLDIVLYVIRELAEEGLIKCNCPDDGDYDVEIHDDHVTVLCKKCGSKKEIQTGSVLAANDFLASDELVLK